MVGVDVDVDVVVVVVVVGWTEDETRLIKYKESPAIGRQ